MTDSKLMQQALDALEYASDQTKPENLHGCDCLICTTILALRDRLAQPEQEPVAWADEIIENLHSLYDSEMIKENDSGDALIRLDAAIAAVEEAEERHKATPRRPWVGLTDKDEIPWDGVDAKSFARAIEAKLKEKNT